MYCAMHPRLRAPAEPARINGWGVGRRTWAEDLRGGLLCARRRDRRTPRVIDLLGLLRGDGGGIRVGHLAQGPAELGDVASQVGADAGCLDLVDLPAAATVRG